MCSILGFAFQQRNKIRTNDTIHAALSSLFVRSQIRGRISTGLALTNSKEIVVLKHMCSAEQFVKTEEYKNALEEYLNFDNTERPLKPLPMAAIGHCRYPTKGEPENRANNHPIISGHTVGVHNGSISNDDEIFKNFNLPRVGRVDSEAIFALIDHLVTMNSTSGSTTNIGKAIVQSTKYLRGGFACAMINARNPYCIWLFRNSMPCNVRHYYNLGMIAWASIESFFTSFEPAKFGPYREIIIPQDGGIGIDLYRSRIERFSFPYSQSAWIA